MTETIINGERCELITDFEQLRSADVVYVVDCKFCGAAHHRALLGRRYPAVPSRDHTGTIMVSPAFSMLPNPHARQSEAVVVPPNVEQRMVWRVIDPLKAKGADVRQGHLDATSPDIPGHPDHKKRLRVMTEGLDKPYAHPPKKKED